MKASDLGRTAAPLGRPEILARKSIQAYAAGDRQNSRSSADFGEEHEKTVKTKYFSYPSRSEIRLRPSRIQK